MAQSAVQVEVISFKPLDEPSAQYDLKHIAAHAVGNTFADVAFVLFIRQGTGDLANGTEGVGGEFPVQNHFLQFFKTILFTFRNQFQQSQRVVEVIEHDDLFVEYIDQIRRIVLFGNTVFNGDMFEITYGVERGKAIESAILAVFAFYGKPVQKTVEHIFGSASVVNILFCVCAVGK